MYIYTYLICIYSCFNIHIDNAGGRRAGTGEANLEPAARPSTRGGTWRPKTGTVCFQKQSSAVNSLNL